MTKHEHVWQDTGFADVDDCVCGVTRTRPSLIEVISEAYHLARCPRPDVCTNKCPSRMPVDLAVAIHKAVVEHNA